MKVRKYEAVQYESDDDDMFPSVKRHCLEFRFSSIQRERSFEQESGLERSFFRDLDCFTLPPLPECPNVKHATSTPTSTPTISTCTSTSTSPTSTSASSVSVTSSNHIAYTSTTSSLHDSKAKQLYANVQRLVETCFGAEVAACNSCPHVVLHDNELRDYHDACSCKQALSRSDCLESTSFLLIPRKKRSRVSIRVGRTSYSFKYRMLTAQSFCKAKTKKYCKKNSALSLLSSTFYLHSKFLVKDSDTLEDASHDCRIVAVKIHTEERINKGQTCPLMFRVTSNEDSRGVAIVKDISYRISLIYRGTLDVPVEMKSHLSDTLGARLEPLLAWDTSVSPEVSLGSDDTSATDSDGFSKASSLWCESSLCAESDVLTLNEVEPSLNPEGRDIAAAREWLLYNGFGLEVQLVLKDYRDGDLCALTREDCIELLPLKDAIRLANLVQRTVIGASEFWAARVS